MNPLEYTIAPGKFLAIWITGSAQGYIAEVIQVEPTILKVMESGPLAKLKEEDYIIQRIESATLQRNDKYAERMLRNRKKQGLPFMSGLKSLGVTDNCLHEIYPQ
jgi:hypothetical protein